MQKGRITFNVNPGKKVRIVCARIIQESESDRAQAQETLDYFKDLVDKSRQDSVSKAQITKCLEIKQKSRDTALKALELIIKTEEKAIFKKAKEGSAPAFNDLDSLTKNDNEETIFSN